VLLGHDGPDGKAIFEPQAIEKDGKPVSPAQQRLDRWHEAMAQRYLHCSYYPWSAAVKDLPPPE
jgi:hypothetical protein